MSREKVESSKRPIDAWVLTYGDMMSLLLTFFILLVSFSSIQTSKFKEAANSLQQAFGVLTTPATVIDFNQPVVPRYDMQETKALAQEVEDLEAQLQSQGLQDQVEVALTSEGARIRIAAPLFFDPGAEQLQPAARDVLGDVAALLTRFQGEVRVEGHTDSVPINTSRFPSNWALSAARAVEVAQYFQHQGLAPQRLQAVGYGEFRPLADNETGEGRARNRRVEIHLLVAGNQPLPEVVPLSEAIEPFPSGR